MEFFSRKQTAKMLGVSLSTLDNLRQERKIGYYQKYPGCKVQFTQASSITIIFFIPYPPFLSHPVSGSPGWEPQPAPSE